MKTEFLILITIIAILFLFTTKEGFSGALTQLVAKGPQDRYLTDSNYIYHPYPEFLWNNGTRLTNYPYYLHFTDHLYYPYYYQPYYSYHPHHPYNYFY